MLDILEDAGPPRSRLLLQTDHGSIHEEDGRAVFQFPGPTRRALRVLMDPDGDLVELLVGTDDELLKRYFEVHLRKPPTPEQVRLLRGMTLVIPHRTGADIPVTADVNLAVNVPLGAQTVPLNVAEVHMTMAEPYTIPSAWPEPSPPILVNLPLSSAAAADVLPELLHGMGAGRLPIRELRLRINPRAYQHRGRRTPFLSEVVEAVGAAVGCSAAQLAREQALRQRLIPLGLRRHLLPDPFFVTWLFRGHRTHGLVPATKHFPVPSRGSRREILRGTPESERERLLAYLSLMEDSAPRLQALAERNLFAVSAHILPNPDLPLFPEHGGIVRDDGRKLVALD